MVVLATAATVIASQAVITGAFSVARRPSSSATCPGCASCTPHARIGQIYVPLDQLGPDGLRARLVFAFQTSAALAFAFGMAVTGTIIITTTALPLLVRSMAQAALGGPRRRRRLLLAVELLFFAANLTKFVHGAWLPLRSASSCSPSSDLVRGRQLSPTGGSSRKGPLATFVDELHDRRDPVAACSGHGGVPQSSGDTTPLAMRATSSTTTSCTSTS